MTDNYNPQAQSPQEPTQPKTATPPPPEANQVESASIERSQEQPQHHQRPNGQSHMGQPQTSPSAQPQSAQAQSGQQPYGQQQYGQPQYGQQPYGQPQYGQASGGYPVPVGAVQKSRMVAGLLGILLPGFAAHNFYLGFTGKAVLQLVLNIFTLGIASLWPFVEGIIYLVNKNDPKWSVDADNIPLRD
ncbi:MAG: TM2 domain-containing protein [Actinomycetaceae bacterium]|nr:TM2 domain-containing protein [Actinomycetaceae bacterium]